MLPFFPILEPADLWATSGIAIFTRGEPFTNTTPAALIPGREIWIGADQWWATPAGLAIAHYSIMTIPFFLSTLGIVNDLRKCARLRDTQEFDLVVWESSDPSEKISLVERPGNRFATSETRPLL